MAEGGAEYWSPGRIHLGTSREFLRTTFLEGRNSASMNGPPALTKADLMANAATTKAMILTSSINGLGKTSCQKWRVFPQRNGVSFEDVVQKATGHPLETLYNDWVTHNRKRFQDTADAVAKAGITPSRELRPSHRGNPLTPRSKPTGTD